jgi:hypothetical protein
VSLIQHLIRHVDADHVTGVADLPGCQKAVEAPTAVQVDNHLTRLQGRDRLGLPQPRLRLAPSGTAASSASG